MRGTRKHAAEAEWLSSGDPGCLLDAAVRRLGDRRTVPYRRFQLVGVAAVRRVERHLTPRGRAALAVAERLADEAMPATDREAALQDIGDGSLDRPGGYRRAPESVYSTRRSVEAATGAVMMLVATTLDEIPFARSSLAVIKITEGFTYGSPRWVSERAAQAALVREVFGNPFRPAAFDPDWRTSTAVALASQMYGSRDFSAMPILADALQEAGCVSTDILDHCRGPSPHVRGCWVVDLVLGKE